MPPVGQDHEVVPCSIILSRHEQLRSVAHLATKEFGQTARPVTWSETYTDTSTGNLGPGEGSGEVLARVV